MARSGRSSSPEAFVADLANGLKDQNSQFLCRHLFTNLEAEDIDQTDRTVFTQILERALQFIDVRRQDEIKVKVEIETFGSEQRAVIYALNPDRPFLFDSVMGELALHHLSVRYVSHPVLRIERKTSGEFVGFHDKGEESTKGSLESFIYIQLEGMLHAEEVDNLQRDLNTTLFHVKAAVQDWRAMLGVLDEVIDAYRTTPPPLPQEEVDEAVAFLEWLRDNNFTFLGCRHYTFQSTPDGGELVPDHDSGLGILQDKNVGLLRKGIKPVTITPEIRAFVKAKKPLIITKANLRSRVHRRSHIDYIGVKEFNAQGDLIGERRFAGMFTSTAYTRSARRIPFVRSKIARVVEKAGFAPDSHSGKALINILENYPRDDLFQIDDAQLFYNALRILELDERPRVRLVIRKDRFERFLSVLVYIPRDRLTTENRLAIGELLSQAYSGRVAAYTPSFPEGPLARMHFIIAQDGEKWRDADINALEKDVAELVRTWEDRLDHLILQRFKPEHVRHMKQVWGKAFSGAYQNAFRPEEGLEHIIHLENVCASVPLHVSFHLEANSRTGRLHIFHYGNAIPLSTRVPMLENMGFRVIAERTYGITPNRDESHAIVLHDIGIEIPQELDVVDAGHSLNERLENLFYAVWHRHAENDGYNKLCLSAGFGWRDIVVLRAYGRYIHQGSRPFSQPLIWNTLTKHPHITGKLLACFKAKFDLASKLDVAERLKATDKLQKMILKALDDVSSLDEDRILRQFLNVIDASLRTNFYQRHDDGSTRASLSFKLDSQRVENLPLPKPFREIFVYSPRVEGVHLRFGKVARGGLRWSDRAEDFRTEVLGLVKAQQVKNAVIVPVGSKGGFVPKYLPIGGTREEIFEEGRESYKIFVTSLLELTDNLKANGHVVPPKNTVRYDEDDPYLVVAADKGTATFSDTANAISIAHDFWLGDAFASGGSAGYDHKVMGITARGGWEAVKRHFREMDKNIQKEDFTVMGVGDMSGDVFGNGMLLSEHIKLIAAFDHRDIFIDPNPDPQRSFSERKRLFEMGRSSWQDYNAALLSKGGGVFSRSSKTISVSGEAKAALGLSKTNFSPDELLSEILKAPLDLLWFGGIGTYVCAEGESNDVIGDKANDSIRIKAHELRVKVIGEGANLGMTQKGRIAAEHHGVKLNTDAIDNSAGVNSSDVEVNIKIAVSRLLRSGELPLNKRNILLKNMTDEVAHLVLANNYHQTKALTIASYKAYAELGYARRIISRLEKEGILNRRVENLPDEIDLEERRVHKRGLTRPEYAVLLAYEKITMFERLMRSQIVTDICTAPLLYAYFPTPLQKKYSEELAAHSLREEIIATTLANAVINFGGITLIEEAIQRSNASYANIARAYLCVNALFGLSQVEAAIDAADTYLPYNQQHQAYITLRRFMRKQILWFLQNTKEHGSPAKTIASFEASIRTAERIKALVKGATPKTEAQHRKHIDELLQVLEDDRQAPDVTLTVSKHNLDLKMTRTYWDAISGTLMTRTMLPVLERFETHNQAEKLVLGGIEQEIAEHLRALTAKVVKKAQVDAKSIPDKLQGAVLDLRTQLDAKPFTLANLILAKDVILRVHDL